ncbi:MAG: PEP-CTERM sorting domain-containing protein [Chthoniobacterales bacterium]|nr:PEP-CTERM sorting domain-containing protein [Chthoniobacterales bacterium]
MKTLLSGIATALLLSLANSASARTLTTDTGMPSFLPNSSFTDNSITAELLQMNGMADLVHLSGDSMVAPANADPQITIGGDFSANSGDEFDVIYNFNVTLGTTDPILLTIDLQTIVGNVQETFSTVLTINPGFGHYQGKIDGPLFSLATSGLWKGHLTFNFTGADGTNNPDPGNLLVKLRRIDYRLGSCIPEPSSYVFLGLGIAAVAVVALRRRQLA